MISAETPLLLGSASPRRRDILSGLGLSIRVEPADIPEEVALGEQALDYVSRIVTEKLQAVAARASAPFSAILVADTVVVIDGRVLGKPQDTVDAARLLRLIVGRTHVVYTRYAISLADAPAEIRAAHTVATEVSLRAATEDEITRYAASGEGLDKAGAYAAQGLGTFLIERIVGSYSNVVGLPACEVVLDLRRLGLLGHFP
ncbi:MAG TPA: Maf family protein [Polyangiaceae bacterium]|nr:Maf family protein [Polyangiaceae bacterium]